jgi:N-acetylneuraminate synthase/N,N'-diacetyllegionaminate synthase
MLKENNWKGKNGPLLIAEIGGNHEGDFEYAKKLTQLAIESGADFVKFQIYTGDGLVSKVESAQ